MPMFCPFCGARVDTLPSGEARCRSAAALFSVHITRQLSDAFVTCVRSPSAEPLPYKVGGSWFCPGCGVPMRGLTPAAAAIANPVCAQCSANGVPPPSGARPASLCDIAATTSVTCGPARLLPPPYAGRRRRARSCSAAHDFDVATVMMRSAACARACARQPARGMEEATLRNGNQLVAEASAPTFPRIAAPRAVF